MTDEILGQCMREKFWEEKTDSEKIQKLAEAVEILGKSVIELERENHLLRNHQHAASGEIVCPISMPTLDQSWYKTHLLGRQPK